MSNSTAQPPIFLVGVRQIAAALGIGPVRVRRMLNAGKLPAHMLDGQCWVSTRHALENWAHTVVERRRPAEYPVNV
ncbi:MAG: helix-turn-helix domain-containing protein [Deltaproteobacteria bacterium]|jgi:hypothetical protein|nr:helix-turn-helix domain-containing protein [Deltaproteobacteria bacterium]